MTSVPVPVRGALALCLLLLASVNLQGCEGPVYKFMEGTTLFVNNFVAGEHCVQVEVASRKWKSNTGVYKVKAVDDGRKMGPYKESDLAEACSKQKASSGEQVFYRQSPVSTVCLQGSVEKLLTKRVGADEDDSMAKTDPYTYKVTPADASDAVFLEADEVFDTEESCRSAPMDVVKKRHDGKWVVGDEAYIRYFGSHLHCRKAKITKIDYAIGSIPTRYVVDDAVTGEKLMDELQGKFLTEECENEFTPKGSSTWVRLADKSCAKLKIVGVYKKKNNPGTSTDPYSYCYIPPDSQVPLCKDAKDLSADDIYCSFQDEKKQAAVASGSLLQKHAGIRNDGSGLRGISLAQAHE